MIYPLYDYHVEQIKGENDFISTTRGSIHTYIRKKYEGQYYLTLMILRFELPFEEGTPRGMYNCMVFNALLQQLIVNAYRFIKFGIVIPEETSTLRDEFNHVVGATLDPDQSPESVRLQI
jgi:hypothetical protein